MRIAAEQMQSVENEECGRKCRVWKMRSVEENAECGKSMTEVENAKCGK